jgi:hypothetical protein
VNISRFLGRSLCSGLTLLLGAPFDVIQITQQGHVPAQAAQSEPHFLLIARYGWKVESAFISLRGHPVPLAPQFPIRLVDCLDQAGEAGSFIDRPCTAEAIAKQT